MPQHVSDDPARDRFGATVAFALGTCVSLFLLWRRWSDAWSFRLFGLPPLQQELNLFSENAFYYSFYRQIIDAPSFADGLLSLRVDNRTEYPRDIDALSRFNLMPEVLLGAVFRCLPVDVQNYCGAFGIYAGTMLGLTAVGSGVLCALAWQTAGGQFACAAAELGLWIAMLVVPVTRSIGVHVTALRENFALPLLHLQTALLASMLRSAHRASSTSAWSSIVSFSRCMGFGIATTLLLFFWQFSGFVLCVQVAALFATVLLLRDDNLSALLRKLVLVYSIATVVQGLAMPGGSAAELSPLPEVLAGIGFVACIEPLRCSWLLGATNDAALLGSIINGVLSLLTFGALRVAKTSAGFVPLSAHVDELFGRKLVSGMRKTLDPLRFGFLKTWPTAIGHLDGWLRQLEGKHVETFDSAVYLEMDEFKALWDDGVFQAHVLNNRGAKISIGVATGCLMMVCFLVFLAVIRHRKRQSMAAAIHRSKRTIDCRDGCEFDEMKGPEQNCSQSAAKAEAKESMSDAIFVVVLTIFFGGLAAFVWRLRVLALPLMSVAAALVLSPRLWGHVFQCHPCGRLGPFAVSLCFVLKWVGGIAGMALSTCYLEKMPEFFNSGLNPDTEYEDRLSQYKMFRWIQKHSGNDRVVLAGAPHLLGTARLGLPHAHIVAHPHYEDPRARRRFKEMKEMLYACAPARIAHERLSRLNVTHLLLDLTSLAPNEALRLSAFYKKRHRCRQDMDLLGMDRTLFQIIFSQGNLFKSLHVVGSYVYVQLLSAESVEHKATGSHPGDTDSWFPLLDQCNIGGRESSDSCGENLGLLTRTLADPLRQHHWVRSMAAHAQARYPNSSRLHAILGRVFDYDLSDFESAARLYTTAATLEKRTSLIWFDLASMFAQVHGARKKKEIGDILEKLAPTLLGTTAGPGPRDVGAQRLCQAAVWSRTLGINSRWEGAFWQMAKLRGRQGCIRDNWATMEGSKPKTKMAGMWDYIWFAD